MRSLEPAGRMERSLTPLVGVVLLIVITVLIASIVSILLVGAGGLLHEPLPSVSVEPGVEVAANGSNASNTLELYHRAGDSVEVENLKLIAHLDSRRIELPIARSGNLSDGTWQSGETLAISLDGTGICNGSDYSRYTLVYTEQSGFGHVMARFGIPVTHEQFTIRNGAVVPNTGYQADVELVGTAFTYGEYGPDIPIDVAIEVGSTRHTPWPGDVNDGANPRSFSTGTQAANTEISVIATAAAYDSFSGRTVRSTADSSWVYVLRDGDPAPSQDGFGDQRSAASFIAPYLDNGTVSLAENQAIFLFEFGSTDPSEPAADYQDAVVVVSLQTVDTDVERVNGSEPGTIVCRAGTTP